MKFYELYMANDDWEPSSYITLYTNNDEFELQASTANSLYGARRVICFSRYSVFIDC